MHGSAMNDEAVTTIDYREAFVLDMEMAAHGPSCKQCIIAALNGKPENFCDRMKYLRQYVQRCYKALPLHYKQRYEDATRTALVYVNESIKEMTGGR